MVTQIKTARCIAALLVSASLAGCAQLPEISRAFGGMDGATPKARSGEAIILGKDDVIHVSDMSLVQRQQHLSTLTTAFEREAPFVVYFDLGDVALDTFATEKLDAQAAWIKEHPEVRVSVTGHADSVGDPVFNHALGLRRAREVVAYLVRRGIDRERLIALSSAGEENLVFETEQEFRTNRRVVTKVYEIVEPRNADGEDQVASLGATASGVAGGSGSPVGSSGGSTGGGSTGGGSTGGGSTDGGSTGGGSTGGGSTGGGSSGGGSGGGGGGSGCAPKDC